MYSALKTETPEFFFFLQVLQVSDYPCTVVRYGTIRYGTVKGHKYVTWSVFNR